MEKKRTFLLITIVTMLMVLLITPFCFFYAGEALGLKITILSVFAGETWFYFGDAISGIVLSGIILLVFLFGLPFCFFFLFLSFIFYLISGKKQKLSIVTFILVGITLLLTLSVVGALIVLSATQALLNMIFFILYCSRHVFWSSNNDITHYLGVMFFIIGDNDCVLHGLIFFTFNMSSILLLFPFVNYIIAIIYGIIGRVKAKKEKLQLANQ